MASAEDTLNGIDTLLKISTNIATPDYKTVVCSIDNGLTGSANVQTTDTKCGIAKSRGAANRTATGSLAANTAPATGEMSANELDALFTSGADFLFEIVNGTELIRKGTGFLSGYNETYNNGDVVKADYTIEIKGNVAQA